jgi:hypothetical protein
MRFEEDNPNNPANILGKMADTYLAHQVQYGESWLEAGQLAYNILPKGYCPKTPDEWAKLGLYFHILNKVLRLGQSGLTHVDSAHDLGAYAAMMEALLKSEVPF